MMRLSITVDPELIEEIRRLAKVRTKREAIERALQELIRYHRLRERQALVPVRYRAAIDGPRNLTRHVHMDLLSADARVERPQNGDAVTIPLPDLVIAQAAITVKTPGLKSDGRGSIPAEPIASRRRDVQIAILCGIRSAHAPRTTYSTHRANPLALVARHHDPSGPDHPGV